MNYWGRIFFIYEQERLTAVKGQPLQNHTENCRRILEHFDDAWFHETSKERLMRAVGLHDEGKKETFRLKYADNLKKDGAKRKKTGKLSYSFSGHRFHVPEDDPYVIALIRSHHEFSVEQINREKAGLSEADKRTFPDDLYLLCMSDHLEAELAVKSIEKKTSAPRTFMEFVTVRQEDVADIYRVMPWPFATEELPLSFHLKTLPLDGLKNSEPRTIQNALNASDSFMEETITITLRR